MGKMDAVSVNYLRDNEWFAQLWNNHGFGGDPVVHPEYLRELDSAELAIIGKNAQKVEFLKKYRDTMRMYKDQMLLMILGIESQQEIHYAMPLRQMIYDGMRYENQRAALERSHRRAEDLSGNEWLSGMAKTDRLIPVLTMVVYWGEKPWDGPKTLRDMLDIPPILDQYNIINDYRLNLLEVNSMENLEQYSGELKALLGFVRYQKDKAALQEFVLENDAIFCKLSQETAQAISVLGNARELKKILKGRKEEKEATIDMCQALQEMIAEGRAEGRAEGMAEGISTLIEACQDLGATREDTFNRLLRWPDITLDQAEEYMKNYWRS